MSIYPDNFYATNPLSFKQSKLIVSGKLKIPVPLTATKQANQIIRGYLNQARHVLRILGGNPDYPLLIAGQSIYKNNYTLKEHLHNVVVQSNRKEHALHAVLNNDHTPAAMAFVFAHISWRSSFEWKNTYNSTRRFLRPLLIQHLLESKMENQNDRGPSRDDNQNLELQPTD